MVQSFSYNTVPRNRSDDHSFINVVIFCHKMGVNLLIATMVHHACTTAERFTIEKRCMQDGVSLKLLKLNVATL